MMNADENMNWDALEDGQLAAALKGGDAGALDAIVNRYQGRVYATAYRLTGNREDALDVAQEVFIKAYRKIAFWQPTGGFLSWLLRMTTNQAIDLLRRRKRTQHESLEDWRAAADGSSDPAIPDTAGQVRAREIDGRIRRALAVLSESQRTAFVLRHYEGLPLNDIADALGCTVGSVKVHLFRAMKKLQKELGDLV